MKGKLFLAAALSITLGGCAGFDGFWDDLRGTPKYYSYSKRSLPVEEIPAFPRYCLANDVPMAGLGQCMEQGVHCYQLDTGAWCAGPYSPFVLERPYEMHAVGWSK